MAVTPVTRDSASAEFFEGTRNGLFLLRRRGTGEYLDPRTVPAPSDKADLEYAPATGGARVVSWATVHGRNHDTGEPIRTVVGIVELDEGPWWWCQLTEVDPDADLTGVRVQVEFVSSGPGAEHEVIPIFRRAGTGCPAGPATR
jgi:uncharacterized OB-fold protein